MKKITIPEVLPLVKAYLSKKGNSIGGSLHIVLDEGNINDKDIKFCRQYAADRNDLDGVELADILLKLSKTQRRKISSKLYE